MKGIVPGQPYVGAFDTGDVVNNATDIAVFVARNQAIDGSFLLSLNRLATGAYLIYGTVPTGYTPGDTVSIFVTYRDASGGQTVRLVDLFIVEDNREYEMRNAAIANFAVLMNYLRTFKPV